MKPLTFFAGGRNPFVPDSPYEFVEKPVKPTKGKGTTKNDEQFDHMLKSEVAMVIPKDDFDGVRRTWSRYEINRGIKGEYSFRRQFNTAKQTYLVWLELRD